VGKLFDQVAEAHFEDKDGVDEQESDDDEEDVNSEDQGDQ